MCQALTTLGKRLGMTVVSWDTLVPVIVDLFSKDNRIPLTQHVQGVSELKNWLKWRVKQSITYMH